MIQSPLYFNGLSITKMAISLEPYVQSGCGCQHNIALISWNTMEMKTEFSLFPSSDYFCLIASQLFRLEKLKIKFVIPTWVNKFVQSIVVHGTCCISLDFELDLKSTC